MKKSIISVSGPSLETLCLVTVLQNNLNMETLPAEVR